MLRKIYIAVDCDDDGQRDAVQAAFNELSEMRMFRGADIVQMQPMLRAHSEDFAQLFNMITHGGIKSLLTIKGGMLIKRLTKA
jgi:hypothetical protein